jgi:hypothetical protein
MPDDAPNVAVAPSPEAAPAANAPESKPFLPQERMDPLLRRLLDSEAETPTEPEKPQEPAKPEPKAAPAAAAPKTESEPEKPIKLRKEKIVRPAVPVAAPPKVELPPEPAKPDPKWEEELKENEREMLSDAREAAELLPARYKELPARVEAFLKKHAEYARKEGFDENAPEFVAWRDANMPRLTRKEIREIETMKVKNEVQKENDAKLNDLKYDFYRKQKEPEIEFRAKQLYGELEASAIPAELAEAIKKDGVEKAASALKLEADTTVAICRAATDDIKEMIRLTEKDPDTGRPLATEARTAADPKWEQHTRLRAIMDDICEGFKKEAPIEQQVVNGKWFATRAEWEAMPKSERHKWWSFNNAQLIDRMKGRVPGAVKLAIDMERKRLEGAGWTRQAPKAAPAPAAPTPPPVSSSAPRSTPIPGASDTPSKDIDARAARLQAAWSRAS